MFACLFFVCLSVSDESSVVVVFVVSVFVFVVVVVVVIEGDLVCCLDSFMLVTNHFVSNVEDRNLFF